MELIYLNAFALALAYALDLAIGDPQDWPHPVRIIGRAVLFGEQFARQHFRGAKAESFAGMAIVILIAGGSSFLVWFVVNGAYFLHFLCGFIFTVYFFYAMIAVQDMAFHVQKVQEALEKKDLPLARNKVDLLVSRDTADLSETEIIRAALESLFESTADGVVAPLFYAALGGPALAVFYKAVNTMDSMLGYKTARYRYLGWAAARLDDVLNFIPARLTAIIFIIAGGLGGLNWKKGWKTLLKDRNKHESPNSAWPEAAAAGVLGIRLGGVDIHRGEQIQHPILNEEGRAPLYEDLLAAPALFKKASFLGLLMALLMILAKGFIVT